MDDTKERADFEATMKGVVLGPWMFDAREGEYSFAGMRLAWMAWQARAALAAQGVPAADVRLIRKIREVCAETLRVGPGVAVSIPDDVREEMRKFMADEPNLIERLPFCEVQALAESSEVRALGATPAPAPAQQADEGVPADDHTVDCIGLALDLEARSKVVDSQTTERAMLAAAHGLRLLAAAQAPAQAQQDEWLFPVSHSGPIHHRLEALANILRDCGRLRSTSGNAEKVLREAATMLADQRSANPGRAQHHANCKAIMPKIRNRATLREIAEILRGDRTLLDMHAKRCGFKDWVDMVNARKNKGKYA